MQLLYTTTTSKNGKLDLVTSVRESSVVTDSSEETQNPQTKPTTIPSSGTGTLAQSLTVVYTMHQGRDRAIRPCSRWRDGLKVAPFHTRTLAFRLRKAHAYHPTRRVSLPEGG